MRVLLRQPTETPDSSGPDRPIDFHRRLPDYQESPLVETPRLAELLGVAKVFVKNETMRYGLPSFKILGASWAAYMMLCERLGPISEDPVSYERLRKWVAPLGPLTLMAATDGNHGRAVARVARWLGLEARIFVPSFVSPERRRAIETEGAEVMIVDGVYDTSVDAALEASCHSDALLISDTARSTVDVAPQLVAAGYATALVEAEQQLFRSGNHRIDAISVQAGVGGLASACTSWARFTRRGVTPHVIVVEPEHAACVMTALAAEEPITISADQVSAMGCLQCGTVSLTAFATLRAGVSCCLAIEDFWAAIAVKELDACKIPTGLSGAAGMAGLLAAFSGSFSKPIQTHLGLTPDACLLVIATESPAASVPM
jgi:diaminopropionate ammonia-lyase